MNILRLQQNLNININSGFGSNVNHNDNNINNDQLMQHLIVTNHQKQSQHLKSTENSIHTPLNDQSHQLQSMLTQQQNLQTPQSTMQQQNILKRKSIKQVYACIKKKKLDHLLSTEHIKSKFDAWLQQNPIINCKLTISAIITRSESGFWQLLMMNDLVTFSDEDEEKPNPRRSPSPSPQLPSQVMQNEQQSATNFNQPFQSPTQPENEWQPPTTQNEQQPPKSNQSHGSSERQTDQSNQNQSRGSSQPQQCKQIPQIFKYRGLSHQQSYVTFAFM